MPIPCDSCGRSHHLRRQPCPGGCESLICSDCVVGSGSRYGAYQGQGCRVCHPPTPADEKPDPAP